MREFGFLLSFEHELCTGERVFGDVEIEHELKVTQNLTKYQSGVVPCTTCGSVSRRREMCVRVCGVLRVCGACMRSRVGVQPYCVCKRVTGMAK